MSIAKTLALGTFLASTLLAGSAFAKAHDQSASNGGAADTVWTTKPGEAVIEETVAFAPSRFGNKPAVNSNARRDFSGLPEHAGGRSPEEDMSEDE